jgi:ribosomal small subunit protein bTHX
LYKFAHTNLNYMGKGDKRTKKGKITKGSYGKKRAKKKKS